MDLLLTIKEIIDNQKVITVNSKNRKFIDKLLKLKIEIKDFTKKNKNFHLFIDSVIDFINGCNSVLTDIRYNNGLRLDSYDGVFKMVIYLKEIYTINLWIDQRDNRFYIYIYRELIKEYEKEEILIKDFLTELNNGYELVINN